MAKFFVGQRVRIIHPGTHHGKVATITAENVDGATTENGRWYEFKGWEVNIRAKRWRTGWCVFEAHDMEPILDRHEPCESEFKESLDKLLSEVSREPA